LASTVPNQLEFVDYSPSEAWAPGIFRPIHYIGSKLRVIDPILEAIDSVSLGVGPVCDLFAGSGTVALALAQSREVLCGDIQEYSRVICSALLKRHDLNHSMHQTFLEDARGRAAVLHDVMSPLIGYEKSCIEEAASAQDFARLCNIVQQGSIVSSETHSAAVTNKELSNAIKQAESRIQNAGIGLVDTLVSRYFGGVYFSYAQAADLDALLATAATQSSSIKDFFVAPILSSASAAVNTIGKHFAQPIKPRDGKGRPKTALIAKIRQDRDVNVFSTFENWMRMYAAVHVKCETNVVLRSDYRDLLDRHRGPLAAVYADPPYTRDHYSRFYHVLETMTLRDAPGVTTNRVRGETRVSRGLYRPGRHQSPFCIRSQAPKAFEELFIRVRKHGAPLILSYSPTTEYAGAQPRVMSIDAIANLARRFYPTVRIKMVGSLSHSKLNSTERILGKSSHAERLLICEL
jgi:adenine-specific DNA-methyltransferase